MDSYKFEQASFRDGNHDGDEESQESVSRLSVSESDAMIGNGRTKHHNDSNHSRYHIAILYALNIFLLITVAIMSLSQLPCRDPSLGYVYSPASGSVEYLTHRFDSAFFNRTEYMGFPNDTMDAMWEDLYNFGVSRITESEASQLLEPTVRALDSDTDYLIELDVFHQLHCLNDLRKSLYPDRFQGMHKCAENGTTNYNTVEMKHWEHCIDSIRQALMCNSDISPVVFHVGQFGDGIYPKLAATHTCRNFDKIRQWGIDHQAGYFRYELQDGDELLDVYNRNRDFYVENGGT